MASLTPRIDKLQKNYLINGDMRIAQRNTSFTSIADSTYNLDRYVYFKTGAMIHNLTQDTDVPSLAQSNYLFQNSLRLNLTTPDTSIAAGDRVEISQIVEGSNWANLAQKDFTLSFWVKATLTGTYCVYFRNSGADRSYIAEYTINAANTWEQKTLHISASTSGGTWNYGNGIGLRIGWTLAAGTTFQTTANAWQTGNFLATANQVNGVNTGSTDFRLTGVMLCEGHLTDPEFVTFGKDATEELAACQRYYELGAFSMAAAGVSGQGFQCYVSYKVTKRATPVVTQFNFSNISNTTVSTAASVGQATQGFICRAISSTTGGLAAFSTDWFSEAEL